MVTDFPAYALPYGVFSSGDDRRRVGIGFGRDLIDLDGVARRGELVSLDPALVTTGRLNELLAAGRSVWDALRQELAAQSAAGSFERDLIPQDNVTMHLGWDIPDYVDFFSSRYHAENCGQIFRSDLVLSENWLHVPLGYHGRTGTIVVDGTPVVRPSGQRRQPEGGITFGPSQRLDIELELGFVLGGSSDQGTPIPTSAAGEHVFGLVLLNDWSARDIQAWEAVPLGPFLGKSFATSVSGWVMPIAAMDHARRPNAPQTDPIPLPYLQVDDDWGFSLDVEVQFRPAGAPEAQVVAAVNAATALYWNPAQQLAHMTVNGASVRPGDLFASGTLSGPERHQRGSLLELSWDGEDPFDVAGTTRTFLEDGDEVTLAGTFPGPDGPIPIGPVSGVVLPSR
ncbi:MAG: fumarylacetoacetase [Acidimicrobiia bacterium]|nr:fumarylacetoacetase [Acidimicrobiia bacterium]